MIEYVLSHNPDDRILKRASHILNRGGLICFPTDTSWVLAACSGQKSAIEKLYKVKKENMQKHFSILCSDISKASEIAHISNNAFKLLKRTIPGHYTFIFEATKKIAKLIPASKTDKEVGVRFVPSNLVSGLIETHGKVLVSTNITHSLLEMTDELEAIYSYHIEDKISHITELIIDPGEFKFSGLSSIISFSQTEVPEVIRVGAGDTTPFR